MMTTSNEHNNAPAIPMSESQRADMICAVAAICTGTSSRTVAATAIEWVERYYGITTPAAPSQPAVPQGYPVLPDYVEDAIERCKNMPGHPPAWVDMMRSMRKALGAATPAPAPAVPQGWRLVPIEPTKEMLDAGLKRKAQARWINGASVLRARTENLRPAEEIAALQWDAMLAAAPAPAPAQDVGLTDEEIFKVAEPFGAFQYGDAQGDKRLDFARAIIAALRAKGHVCK